MMFHHVDCLIFFFHSDHHPLDPSIEIMEKYCENCLTGIEY